MDDFYRGFVITFDGIFYTVEGYDEKFLSHADAISFIDTIA